MTYETKEQARPVPAAANQTSVETNPIRLEANQVRLKANRTSVKAYQTRLTTNPVRLEAYQTRLKTNRTGLKANHAGLMANPVRLEAKSVRLPANRMYQGMSLRPSKATEAISTIRIQEIAATPKGPRNNEGRGVIYSNNNSKRLIHRLPVIDEKHKKLD